VLGTIHHSPDNGNLTLQATMVDTIRGELVAQVESTSLNELVAAFSSRHVVERIPFRRWEIRGEILKVSDDYATLNVGDEFGIRKGDHLRLERVLEPVPDPFSEHRGGLLGHLTATVGQAQVEEAGHSACLIRASCIPRIGDIGIVT
jgi:hypothetical protein